MKIYKPRKYQGSIKDTTPRRLAAYGAITLIILAVMAVWGVTLLANLSNFWDALRGNNTPAPLQQNSVTTVPTLTSLPSSVNKSRINISGTAQSGAVVTLYKSGTKVDSQLVGNDGQFSFKNVVLKQGTNSFTAKSQVGSDPESAESNTIQVILDTTAPKLTINQPTDSSTTNNQFLTVSGKTEPNSIVTINSQQQIVGGDGSFSGVATLSGGPNTITIIATDEAGNTTQVVRTVTYSP